MRWLKSETQITMIFAWYLKCNASFFVSSLVKHTDIWSEIKRLMTFRPRTLLITSCSRHKTDMSRLMTKPTKWHVRPAKTQISLGIRPVWSESSLSSWRKAWVLSCPLSTQRRLLVRLGGCPGWSESSLGAQSFCWFRHEAANIIKATEVWIGTNICSRKDYEVT